MALIPPKKGIGTIMLGTLEVQVLLKTAEALGYKAFILSGESRFLLRLLLVGGRFRLRILGGCVFVSKGPHSLWILGGCVSVPEGPDTSFLRNWGPNSHNNPAL